MRNAKEIFDYCDPIPKLTSIAPNEKLELNVSFVQRTEAHSGEETDVLSDIPTDKADHYLLIQYENERGTKFLTKFVTSFTKIQNEYTYG